MKRITSVVAAVLVLAACQSKKQDDLPAADTTAAAAASGETHNQLSADEQANGWELLFDGTTMNGWRTYKNQEVNSWEVLDGTLHCKPAADSSAAKRGDLVTTGQYENFEFTFDWKIAPHDNSGVIYRVSEAYDVPYASGPEYQVIDDTGYPDPLQDVQLSAANYDMHATNAKTVRPAGEWNQGKIVVNKNHVEHWLNGTKVVEYEFQSDDWKKRRAASKWKDYPGYGSVTKGHLDLQDHGGQVWYRNLKIKTL